MGGELELKKPRRCRAFISSIYSDFPEIISPIIFLYLDMDSWTGFNLERPYTTAAKIKIKTKDLEIIIRIKRPTIKAPAIFTFFDILLFIVFTLF